MTGIDFMAGLAASAAADAKGEKKEEKTITSTSGVKKVFYRQGNVFQIIDEPKFDFLDNLPAGTYSICASMEGYYLERRDDFGIDHKVYGIANSRAQRIMNTFEERSGNTGLLLEGEKGSGKTLLTKVLARDFVAKGYVCLLVSGAFCGPGFNDFLANIKQPALVVFDEFEKMYNDEKQTLLLSTFDGLFSAKKLFAVTVNDTYKVNAYFKNRPGRFMYRYNYTGLEDEFIKEYCEDNLKDQSQIPKILTFATVMGKFNFDMLKHMVEDMNRYKETVGDVLKHLNIQTDGNSYIRAQLTAMFDDKGNKIELTESDLRRIHSILPFGSFTIEVHKQMEEGDDKKKATKDDALNRLLTSALKRRKEQYGHEDDDDEDEDETASVIINGSKDLTKFTQEHIIYRNDIGEFHFRKAIMEEKKQFGGILE